MAALPLDLDFSHERPLAVSTFREERELVRTIRYGTSRSITRYRDAPNSGDHTGDWWASFLAGSVLEQNDPNGRLSIVDLFSGAGGFTNGARQAGAELGFQTTVAAAVDHDPDALAVFRTNHEPSTTYSGSVTSLVDYRIRGSREDARFRYEPEMIEPEWSELVGNIDLVLAGPPCQGHSNLNNHTRRVDKRNELYLTVPAIAVALNAPIVIIENVPAVVSDEMGVVESTISLLTDAGYEIETGVLRAAEMGWPQRRNRFFLVARRDRSPLPLMEVQDALTTDPRPVMWALAGYEDPDSNDHMSRLPQLSRENRDRIDWLFENDEYDLGLSERPESHRGGTSYTSVYGRMRPDLPSQTVTTGFMTPGRGRYIHPTRRRVITPREAARLQGFPNDYVFRVRPGEDPTARSLGKWIGDAVPLPLGHAATMSALAPGPVHR